MLRISLEVLRGVLHPEGKRRRIVDHDVELLAFQRARVAVEITDELFGDLSLEKAWPRLAAIKESDAMSARERIVDLFWAGEAGAAEDENVERSGCASGIRPHASTAASSGASRL